MLHICCESFPELTVIVGRAHGEIREMIGVCIYLNLLHILSDVIRPRGGAQKPGTEPGQPIVYDGRLQQSGGCGDSRETLRHTEKMTISGNNDHVSRHQSANLSPSSRINNIPLSQHQINIHQNCVKLD